MEPSALNASCPAHQAPAVATCTRCGAFACAACLTRRGGRDVCSECAARIDPLAARTERAGAMAWQGLMAAAVTWGVGGFAFLVPGGFVLAGLVAVIPIVLGVRSLRVGRGTGDRTVAVLGGLSVGCGTVMWLGLALVLLVSLRGTD